MKKTSQGYGLLELLLGLAVGGVLLVAVLGHAQVAQRQLRVSEAVQLTRDVAKAGYEAMAAGFFVGESDGSNRLPMLAKYGYVPPSVAAQDAGPWHAGLTLQTLGGTGEPIFHIAFAGLPASDCRLLQSSLKAVVPTGVCRSIAHNALCFEGDLA